MYAGLQLNSANLARLIGSVGPFATITGSLTPGNIPILTLTGIEDSGVALVQTMDPGTVWSNNTSSAAAPLANTVLNLGAGSASAVPFGFVGSTGTGMFSPTTDRGALSAGGNKAIQWRTADATSFIEYLYSGGVIWRAQGGTNVEATYAANGTGNVYLANNGASGNAILFRASGPATAGGASNYLRTIVGDGAGNGPSLVPVAQGTGDTNIDILLTPLGTGVLRFGTHSAIGAETVTGYILQKDAAGNLRKMAVVS